MQCTPGFFFHKGSSHFFSSAKQINFTPSIRNDFFLHCLFTFGSTAETIQLLEYWGSFNLWSTILNRNRQLLGLSNYVNTPLAFSPLSLVHCLVMLNTSIVLFAGPLKNFSIRNQIKPILPCLRLFYIGTQMTTAHKARYYTLIRRDKSCRTSHDNITGFKQNAIFFTLPFWI